MNQTLTDRLHLDFPNLFPTKLWFECGDGWYDLLRSTCITLSWHLKTMPDELRDQIFFQQIKEKFGLLRLYLSETTPFIDGVVAMAEEHSSSVCEECGYPGKERPGGWIKTLCDVCKEAK
jgi:hypothetical protein